MIFNNTSNLQITREVSFRGREYLAWAHTKKNGVTDVITFNMNVFGKKLEEMGCWDDDVWTITFNFIIIDFHEWLHLFIHHSGIQKMSRQSNGAENFILSAGDALKECIRKERTEGVIL